MRNHPTIVGIEIVLLVGIGTVLFAHVEWQEKLATAPRAFHEARAEGALLERLSFRDAVYVNAEFHHHGRFHVDDMGVESVTVPERSPAHIFRLHPEDRRHAFERTPGPDYFLEDAFGEPFEHEGGASDVHVPGGSESIVLDERMNGRVYVIDGNLWLHSPDALEVRLVAADGSPVRVTFVVRGNIYFLDDVRAHERGASIAFIALPRPGFGEGGGDVWMGDVVYGTLSYIEGYVFAAGDIQGGVLGEDLVVNGALAAGGEISVSEGHGCHPAELVVAHDLRYAHGSDVPPGM